MTQNLSLFREMTKCIEGLYHWTYAPDGSLMYSNCPEEQLFHALFTGCGFPEQLAAYAREHSAPYALSTYTGLVWYAVFEKEDEQPSKTHVLGPALIAPTDEEALEAFLQKQDYLNMQFHSRHIIIEAIEALPVIFQKQFGQLALMLHYCVNGEHLSMDDLRFLDNRPEDEHHSTSPALYRDIRLHALELLDALRMGDTAILNNRNLSLAMLPTNAAGISQPLRQLKDTGILFTAQCANAAIDGGLSPENAYPLADRYIGQMEKNLTVAELTSLIGLMYQDFLTRVQALRTSGTNYSPAVSACIAYMELHIEDDVSIASLSEMMGYSTYYLSRKFKEETGVSVKEYLREKRIEKGARLLRSTELGLDEIAERLHFCSRSHFSDTFHRIMGLSPSEYRKKMR